MLWILYFRPGTQPFHQYVATSPPSHHLAPSLNTTSHREHREIGPPTCVVRTSRSDNIKVSSQGSRPWILFPRLPSGLPRANSFSSCVLLDEAEDRPARWIGTPGLAHAGRHGEGGRSGSIAWTGLWPVEGLHEEGKEWEECCDMARYEDGWW